MAMAKRIFFFALVNILILVMVSITTEVVCAFFGIENNYLTWTVTFSVIAGFGGAFLSLFMSKFMATKMMGVQIIDPNTSNPQARALVEKVHNLARQARLPKMPEVGYYDSPEINAFATGPSKSNSLVAVSSGLLQRMNDDEVEGVLGHEVAHVANGDMVTMTLIQGVVNTFVLFLSRIFANLVAGQMDRNAGPLVHFGLIILFQVAFGILGSLVVNFFSRYREYRADHGGSKLAGRDKMIKALQALRDRVDYVEPSQEAVANLKIAGVRKAKWMEYFSSHPPLERRIRRLEMGH